MLRVFSSIRKNLITGNNTVRYLKYAVGEILLVIIGILIALQINTWNQNRLLRIEEREVISRLIIDIENDNRDVDHVLRGIDTKNRSFSLITRTIAENKIDNSKELLAAFLLGTHRSLDQPTQNRATYDDLIGSGRLGIIESADLRAGISSYYKRFQQNKERLDEHETDYSHLVYQLIPRGDGVRDLDTNLTPKQIDNLAELVLESPIVERLTAETNFGKLVQDLSLANKQQAEKLIGILKAYQKEIQN